MDILPNAGSVYNEMGRRISERYIAGVPLCFHFVCVVTDVSDYGQSDPEGLPGNKAGRDK